MHLTQAAYADLVSSPLLDDHLTADDPVRLIVVMGGGVVPAPGSLPFVVAATAAAEAVDVVVDPADVGVLAERVHATPLAAITFVTLLRAAAQVPVDAALALESAAYSTLQAGPEFARWRASRQPPSPEPERGPAVRAARRGDTLDIELHRPARHNAVTARLRDELCAALSVALVDDSIEAVVLTGAGPSFCSGGDLDEFGARSDPASAHIVRLTRSPARLLARLAARTEVRIHGHTLGAGIEMAAFAGRVVAAADTRIALPELGLGLVPGAGGTVSLPRRIGRQRTAWLGLTGHTIDAETARQWCLVDALSP